MVTNPPYMGASGMGAKLSDYVKKNFPDSKADMFAVFIERCGQMAKKNGYQAMITQPSFLFLTSFERLREKTVTTSSIENLLHMGRGIFGIDFGSIAFVIKKRHLASYKGVYLRLHERTFQYIEPKDIAQLYIRAKENHSYRYSFVDYTTDDGIVEQPVTPNSKQIYYEASQDNFSKIPGSPVAYWVSSATLQTFAYPSIGQIARPRQGLATGCNDIFIRLWYEVNEEKVNYMAENLDSAVKSQKKWFPYNKGGDYRRWYGNNEYLVNWERDGFEIRHFVDEKGKLRSRPQNTQYYFHRCISWSLISSGRVAFRYKPDGHIFDVSGMSCFTESNLLYLLGLCNTPVVDEFLSIFSPTINFQAGDIANIPVAIEVDKIEDVEKVVSENIQVSKKDWDSYETSWDFTRNPLV